MRGSPPLHLILFALLFALLMAPLVRLTASRVHTLVSSTATSRSGKVRAVVRVRTTHAPSELSLKLNGAELIPEADRHGANGIIEWDQDLPDPHDGLELVLQAAWAPGTGNTAVEVEVEPTSEEAKSITRWSDNGQIASALLFHW